MSYDAHLISLHPDAVEPRFNPNHGKGGKFAAGSGGGNMQQLWGRANAGGFTFSTVSGSHVSSGFALSPYPKRSKVIEKRDFTPGSIRSYRDANQDLLSKPNHFMGAWREKDASKGIDRVWMDVSIVLPDRSSAEKVGRDHDQVAMYDLGKGQEITLGGTGGRATSGDSAWRREQRGDRPHIRGPDG